MQPWKGIIGRSFTKESFVEYCNTLVWNTWRPSFIVLHNTSVPNLAQRPDGLTMQHMLNFENYYRNLGWSGGPHLFIDDKQIWVFTPLTVPGVHSPSWNGVSLGVEMLGDYGIEPFDSGRGLLVKQNTISAIATLTSVLGLSPDAMRLHKEDPVTTNICPGINVMKANVIAQVKDSLQPLFSGEHPPAIA